MCLKTSDNKSVFDFIRNDLMVYLELKLDFNAFFEHDVFNPV
jgi:hypothetical protein